MVKIIEMDENTPIKSQLEENVGTVILLNKFTVSPEDVDKFLKGFENTTKVLKKQSGFISAQLHRGIAESHTFINYAVWKSAEHFKRAFNSTEFRASSNDLSANIVMALHLFKKTAIPDIYVD